MKISSFNDATTHGFLTRYNFGGVAVELEQMRVDGDLDAFGSDGDYDLRAAGIYAVYRTFGDLYFKARLGSLKEKASADIASFSGG